MSEIHKTFEFGPGTPRPRSHMRTFSVPAGAAVGVAIQQMEAEPSDEPVAVTIDVLRADAGSIGSSGPDGPRADAPQLALAPSGVVPYSNKTFVSDFGCPSTWRVRVRALAAVPAARVSGTIVMVVDEPGPVRLKMTGSDTQHLDPNVTSTRTLGPDGPGRILGTGRFRIRAKWHADPANLLAFGSFPELTVALMRPDGSLARDEKGFSQHSAGVTPKVDFTYNVTPADAALPGTWKLRVRNNSTVRVVDFDIDRGLDPNPAMPTFVSTFLARCP